MSPRHAPAHGARRSGPRGARTGWARGVAIVVAVAGIGVGTWVLGSEPESSNGSDGSALVTDSSFSAVPGTVSTPTVPVVTEPPLSVAPVPPAGAEQRAAGERATRKDRPAKSAQR